MDVNKFKQQPIMGILRGIEENIVEPLIETVVSAGLQTIEIAMNTPDAPKLISRTKKLKPQGLSLGAGTVLTMEDLKKALDSGATFIVQPVFVPSVVEYCVKNKIPVFPGALTAQEIYNAWSCGATMIKVFPVKFFGPAYIKEIKAPFQDIELLACGGVTPANIGEFFSCGASAVAFGGSVFRKDWLSSGDFSSIGEHVSALIAGLKQ